MAKKQTKKNTQTSKSCAVNCAENKHTRTMKRQETFNKYCAWSTMPSICKGRDIDYQKKIGFGDEEALELLSVKNDAEFSKKFKVHRNTLLLWKEKMKSRDPIKDARIWLHPLVGNVLFNLYRQAVGTSPSPGIFKTYFSIVHQVGEKVDISLKGEVKEAVERINKLLPN